MVSDVESAVFRLTKSVSPQLAILTDAWNTFGPRVPPHPCTALENQRSNTNVLALNFRSSKTNYRHGTSVFSQIAYKFHRYPIPKIKRPPAIPFLVRVWYSVCHVTPCTKLEPKTCLARSRTPAHPLPHAERFVNSRSTICVDSRALTRWRVWVTIHSVTPWAKGREVA